MAIQAADLVTLSKVVPMLLPVLRADDEAALAAALDAHFAAANQALALLTHEPVDALEMLAPMAWLDLLGAALDANSDALTRMAEIADLGAHDAGDRHG